mmetsp:Transcript_19459/g.31858  ORF Transcript_19459/g.31858 Transcript_19459/m.31858 type:complete len:345 (+) Transcript_19459:53-1087(+)
MLPEEKISPASRRLVHKNERKMSSEEEENGLEEKKKSQKESRGKMLQRHKREVKELKSKTDAIMHSHNKKDKSAKKKAEDEIKKLEDDLKHRHAQEIASLEATPKHEEDAVQRQMDSVKVTDANDHDDEPPPSQAPATEVLQWKVNEKKPSKAQKRRTKMAEKDAERERQKDEERANAPNERKVEMDHLNAILGPKGYGIREVAPDGNCLYRAIADQLLVLGRSIATSEPHLVLRRLAADFMLAHPDDFVPFLDLEEESPVSLDEYCKKMAGTAAWGGQLEIQALARALKTPVTVYSATAPPVTMGTEFHADADQPVLISFHKHAYGLGEHYNSIVPTAQLRRE